MRKFGLAAALVSVLVASAWAQERPPSGLHLEGDHWTAWNPPESYPEGTNVYIIKAGDTLWDLAAHFLSDPYLWPQIWEQNQYILDAHWIYPNDPLRIDGVQAEAMADADGVAGAPLDEEAGAMADGAIDDPFATAIGGEAAQDPTFGGPTVIGGSDGPIPLGSEWDIYCSGFIADADRSFAYSIGASEHEFLTPTLNPNRYDDVQGLFGKSETRKFMLSIGDIVYIDGGSADGLTAGELLSVVWPMQLIEHPLRDESFGRYYKHQGRLRILSTQEDTSIAEIVLSCEPMRVGALLQVFEPEPVPLRRMTPMRPANYPASPDELEASGVVIIHSDRQLVTMGDGHIVHIDSGFEDDVAPGDVFTLYRRGRRGFPPIVLGEIGVLSVQARTALARIVNSRYTVFVGDLALPK